MPQLPGLLRRALKGPFRSFERWRLRGDRIVCPVCGGHFDRLLPRWGHPNRQCPACHSLVRHRALWLLLHDELQIVERRPRILHFAPERGIARRIRATGADYVTGDIAARDPAERIDITRIPFPDASFDLAICSHVLEHVPDDRAAISELRRVLRPDGLAILVVPIKRERTLEFIDPSPVPAHPDGYQRRGGHGHVREIGADYPDRIRAGGFTVEAVDYADRLSPEDLARYAIEHGEPFYLCRPAPVPVAGDEATAPPA